MGEPLANYDNVCRAVAVLNSPRNGSGVASGYTFDFRSGSANPADCRRKFAIQLADFSPRSLTMNCVTVSFPINRKYPLNELISACKEYTANAAGNIFIEYALFNGVNDSIDAAEKLRRLLDGLPCSINLIVGNPVPSSEFQPSSREVALIFQKTLINSGIRTMLRVSRGTDIEAGCGQLRSRWLDYLDKS